MSLPGATVTALAKVSFISELLMYLMQEKDADYAYTL